jgi:hypothetical protein
MDFEAALTEAQSWLDEIDGVVGVGQGEADGKPAIVVSVERAEVSKELPAELHGHPVVVDPTGIFNIHESLDAPPPKD